MLNNRNNINLADLWNKFIEANTKPELKDWRRKVYVKGQQQSIGNKLAEHGERVIKEREDGR